jgi:polar amino acid transport system permease protein
MQAGSGRMRKQPPGIRVVVCAATPIEINVDNFFTNHFRPGVSGMQNGAKARIAGIDIVIILALLLFFFYLAYRVKVGMAYRWDWAVIPQYLFRFDPEQGRWVPNILVLGFITTIKLSFWSMLLATIIGTTMGMLRTSGSLFRRMISRTYVETIRNMPPLVMVFIFYFFLSDQFLTLVDLDGFVRSQSEETQRTIGLFFAPPAHLSAFVSALVTLALYEGAYITEIVRSGILSIDRGQWEASYAVGLSKYNQMRDIILPQAFQRILPPLAGQLISTIKDSAIVSVISIQELTFQGLELMAATYLTIEVWITITAMYFVLTFGLSLGVRQLELHYQKRQ